MAYQPKSYRKFLATSVTAAVVASAVAPVAALAADENVITNDFVDVDKNKHAWAVEAIDYLVGKKAIEGKGNKTFDIHGNLTRAEAAAILARTLELDVDKNAKPNFSDTDGHWGAPEIAAIQNDLPGVIEGYQGKFNPNNNITRQELAKIIVEAYELELVEGADVDFPDNNGWGEDYVEILASNGIVIGKPNGNFEPNAYVSRGEAAVFFHRTEVESARVEVPGVNVPLTVDSVSATNATTLTITGAGLDKLEADNIKVEGINVSSVLVSEDGKTATVALESALTPDEAVTVTVNGKDYEVTYKIVADSVKVLEATYDDNKKDQFVAFTVNGKNATAQELLENGYAIEFEAFHGKGNKNVTSELFDNTTTGELNELIEGDYDFTEGEDFKVSITLSKGSEVITSELGTITIKNTGITAEGITDYTLKNGEIKYENGVLVTGETAVFEEIKIKTGNDEEKIDKGFTVKSSDEGIVSVDSSGDQPIITAQGPGKATLTITYGGSTKTVTIEVKNDERKIDKVVFEDERNDKRITSINAVKGNDVKVKVIALDQYGDEMAPQNLQARTSNKSVATIGEDGETTTVNLTDVAEIKINGEDKGTATITFYKEDGYPLPKSSILTVKVSEAQEAAKYEFAQLKSDKKYIDSIKDKFGTDSIEDKSEISDDTTLDFSDDRYAVLELKAFTSGNAELDAIKLSDEEEDDAAAVTINASDAGVIEYEITDDNKLILQAGSETGTATVTVKYDGKTFTKKFTIVDEGYEISSVSFKSISNVTSQTTLNYKSVLTVKGESSDSAELDKGQFSFKGNKKPAQAVRIATETGKEGIIFIDKDNNRKYEEEQDVVLGELTMDLTGEFANRTGITNDKVDSVISGFLTSKEDDGNVIFKVLEVGVDGEPTNKVLGSKSVKVDY